MIRDAEYLPVCTAADAAKWESVRDLSYVDAEESDPFRKESGKLDIHFPSDRRPRPVLLYFHGGGLVAGDKANLIEEMRLLNCVLVSANYRLAPQVRCPAYLEDAALAASWVKRNIAEYGGDPDNIFLCGGSAGAYLCAMLAADRRLLERCGCAPEEFRGYIPISGEMMTHFHVREEQGIPATMPKIDEYAPLSYVRKDFPPMLLITGETGIEMDCRPAENKLMHDLLAFNGNTDSQYFEMKGLTHATIWNCINPWIRDFIALHLARS